jgi:hypothetical protein
MEWGVPEIGAVPNLRPEKFSDRLLRADCESAVLEVLT